MKNGGNEQKTNNKMADLSPFIAIILYIDHQNIPIKRDYPSRFQIIKNPSNKRNLKNT